MAQSVQYSINISALHLVAALAISHVLFKSPVTKIVDKRLDEMVDTVYGAGKNLILDFPVVALVTGFTYGLHLIVEHYAPFLSLSTQAEGSLKVAAFVGEVFALKAALSPLLEKVTQPVKEWSHGEMIRNTVVLHFFPLAVGVASAYYGSIPVRLATSALYTATLIGIVKLLGKGVDTVLEQKEMKARIQSWYSWMTLEKAAE